MGARMQVLRLDRSGRARQVFARRRDLLKEHRLQPRDLRRIDPSVDVNKTPPSITIKDNVILLCLGGVRYGGWTRGAGGASRQSVGAGRRAHWGQHHCLRLHGCVWLTG